MLDFGMYKCTIIGSVIAIDTTVMTAFIPPSLQKKKWKMSQLKRLVADIPEKVHQELKVQAAIRKITMRKYVLRAILEKLNYDTKHQQNESSI